MEWEEILAKDLVFTSSSAEKDKLLKEGYVVTTISYFSTATDWTYCLEQGSAWSQMLGSK